MKLDNDLYIIEYNAKQDALHLELLSSRLRKNIVEFVLYGKQQSPGWVTVGVMIGNKAAAELCEAFRILINKTRVHREKTK
jgi:hypothetical protein